MSTQDDAVMRRLILGKIYDGRASNRTFVHPGDFTPPIDMRDIKRIAAEFWEDKILKSSPDGMKDYITMRISARGQGVWLGRAHTDLEIEGLPPL